jgi:hypothetical protein
MFAAKQVTVGTSATKIVDVPAGMSVTLINGLSAFTLGSDATVAPGTGCPIAASQVIPAITGGLRGWALWGIVDSGSATVGYILSRNT